MSRARAEIAQHLYACSDAKAFGVSCFRSSCTVTICVLAPFHSSVQERFERGREKPVRSASNQETGNEVEIEVKTSHSLGDFGCSTMPNQAACRSCWKGTRYWHSINQHNANALPMMVLFPSILARNNGWSDNATRAAYSVEIPLRRAETL